MSTAALLGVITAPCLQGQEGPYHFSFKTRAGLTAGDIQKYHFDNKIISFGFEVKRKMFGEGSALAAELAFDYVPGRHHDVMVPDHGVSGGLGLDPYWSTDDRKEWGQGWSLRASYISPMPSFGPPMVSRMTKKIDWYAGLSIDRHKVSSEFEWSLRDSSAYPPHNPDPMPPLHNAGSGRFTENGSDVTIGVFAGLRFRVTDEIDFEMSLRNFGMKHWDFTPGAYLGFPPGVYVGSEAGKLEVGGVRGWALEFALAVKL
jgi:hypothetical protein